jgi:hypothetical protein
METYLIWRDGEEVEVGWFGLMRDRYRRFWKICKQTDWKHYFKGNGPGKVVWKHFTGFEESQNSVIVAAQWIVTVKGGLRNPLEGNMYYRTITVYDLENNWRELAKIKVAEAERAIDLYVESDCTCRIGFHRRCPHHFNTRD